MNATGYCTYSPGLGLLLFCADSLPARCKVEVKKYPTGLVGCFRGQEGLHKAVVLKLRRRANPRRRDGGC